MLQYKDLIDYLENEKEGLSEMLNKCNIGHIRNSVKDLQKITYQPFKKLALLHDVERALGKSKIKHIEKKINILLEEMDILREKDVYFAWIPLNEFFKTESPQSVETFIQLMEELKPLKELGLIEKYDSLIPNFLKR